MPMFASATRWSTRIRSLAQRRPTPPECCRCEEIENTGNTASFRIMARKTTSAADINAGTRTPDGITDARHQEILLKTGALQKAIFNSANFSIIATDEKGIIQLFNIGAERMLGYAAAEVVNKIKIGRAHV